MPYSDPAKQRAYQKEWAKTKVGRASLDAARDRYRVTSKGIMNRTREYARVAQQKGGVSYGDQI